MRAAPLLLGGEATGEAAIRRAAAAFENRLFEAANDRFEADEALDLLIDDAITDADYLAAVAELDLEAIVESKARDIVARRLREQGAFA